MAATQGTSKKDRKVTRSPAEENARQVLNIAARLLGQKNEAIGQRLDKSTQWVQQRRSGETRIRLGLDEISLAQALDVPVELFSMDPLDAGSWILTNRSEQVIAASRCTEQTPSGVCHLGIG